MRMKLCTAICVMIKYQSEGFHYGNPPDHDEAVKNVQSYLKSKGLFAVPEWYVKFNYKFNQANGLRSDYAHSYDLAVLKQMVTGGYPQDKCIGFIEVDGFKHGKKNQKINDGIAEKYALEIMKLPTIRLSKVECLGELEDRTKYFKENIGFV